MKKTIIPLFYILFVLLSCSDNDDTIMPACGVNNPIQELEWLRTEIERRKANPNEDMKYCYIIQAEFNGEDIFVYEDCNPFVDKAIPFFNCEGTMINTQDNPIGFDDIRNKVIIWKPKNFVCNIDF
ncbi:hypothetical protein FEE95_16165 [Maribacter algarum]|uniref:Uncharacterized protein n=1 Tax=Maribacter algarum (ex Zhang et al. 2020) TaxID=2578118 RepID=A0A5S3PNU4_9FLAO|nr:hypothetical protein [Maribacter algarum]TMM56159.1 hypothetical protein FEE95_16165 [Maribacter algarum]